MEWPRAAAAAAGKTGAQSLPIAEVLAVDNGSTDGAAEAAEQRGARVVRMGANLGFSRAVNAGIEACGTELIAVVNSDVEPEPDWLARLAGALESPEIWFATGKILSLADRGRIDGTYDLISRGGCGWRVGEGRPDGPEFSRACEISMAPGTAALFKTELFRRVGRFDDTFDSYLEDVDFGLRCAAAGLKGQYVPEAVAYHKGSASLGRWNPLTVRRISRNQVYLVAKHFPVRRYWWPILVGQALWGLLALRHGAGWAFTRGKLDGLMLYAKWRRRFACGSEQANCLPHLEREIAAIQRRTGFDLYWRVYFLLTSSGTD